MNRVLFVYYYCNLGGVCSVVKQRMPSLRRAGWAADCLFTEDNGGEASLRSAGIENVHFTTLEDLPKRLRELCAAGHYRLFTLFDMPEAIQPVLDIEERYKIFFEIHTPLQPVMERNPPALLSLCSTVVVPSAWSKDRVLETHPQMDASQITVIPNIVEDDIFYCADSADALSHRAVIWMGKFAAYKNPEEGLAVLASLLAEHPELHGYFITGGAPSRGFVAKACGQLAAQGSLARFHWLHNLPHHAVGAFYRSAAASKSVFLHTSVSESFCLAVHEAARCGLPVVAADAGPLPEIIDHGNNGFLYSSGEPEAAVQFVTQLLEDAALYRDAAGAHRKALRRFDNATFSSDYHNLLSKHTGWPARRVDAAGGERRQRETEQPKRLRVAAILDEFSRKCFAYELEIHDLTPTNWRDVIASNAIDFVLLEAAWVGHEGSWARKVAYEAGRAEVYELVDGARQRGLPVVFWNKEDPMHYDLFIGLAARCDYIFTTDANLIERYRVAVGHDRVFPLPFAAQPAIHNPLGKCEQDGWDLLFAGTWYERFPERNRFLDEMREAVAIDGFHIYDRHFFNTNREMRFPDRYAGHIYPAVPYDVLLDIVKGYKVVMNVNTVVDSPTMCARRPFEVSAAATPVVSNSATALDNLLPGLVFQADDRETMRQVLADLLSDRAARLAAGHRAWRHVMEHHTYAHRVHDMATRLGFGDSAPAVVWPAVTLVLIGGEAVAEQNYPGTIEQTPYHPRLVSFNDLVAQARGEVVVVCDATREYGECLVKDLVLAAKSAGADIVGKMEAKGRAPVGDNAWQYVTKGRMPVFTFHKRDTPALKIDVTSEGLHVSAAAGTASVYSCDPFWG